MAAAHVKFLGALCVAATVAMSWVVVDYQRFRSQPLHSGARAERVSVTPGLSMRGIALALADRGLLKHPSYLILLARWRKQAHLIQAGEYDIPPGFTPEQLLDRLVSGTVVQHSLTLLEGWTYQQMMDAIRAHAALAHTLDGVSPEVLMERLGRAGEHPEGRFLAETYHFPRGTRDLAFLRRAYRAMQRHLDAEWAERDAGLPFKTPYEALILASIVEKETGLAAERREIAGVFVRRLESGMRLQTDPTVIYGLGGAFDGNLRRRDLQQDTSYNTYLHAGLPPTPIAMPGLDSLRAVMHPADGRSLYFVAKGDGSHIFSETLEAHNEAVRKYQLRTREARSKSSTLGSKE